MASGVVVLIGGDARLPVRPHHRGLLRCCPAALDAHKLHLAAPTPHRLPAAPRLPPRPASRRHLGPSRARRPHPDVATTTPCRLLTRVPAWPPAAARQFGRPTSCPPPVPRLRSAWPPSSYSGRLPRLSRAGSVSPGRLLRVPGPRPAWPAPTYDSDPACADFASPSSTRPPAAVRAPTPPPVQLRARRPPALRATRPGRLRASRVRLPPRRLAASPARRLPRAGFALLRPPCPAGRRPPRRSSMRPSAPSPHRLPSLIACRLAAPRAGLRAVAPLRPHRLASPRRLWPRAGSFSPRRAGFTGDPA
nr:proline-rich receptor-like protein kinase PERK9 [Aegilops tauschii subsp. strangulata]